MATLEENKLGVDDKMKEFAVKEDEGSAPHASVVGSELTSPLGLDFSNRVKFRCCGKGVSEKYYMLGLFTIINLFLFADQNLLAPNLSVIAREFNFTDDERDQYLGGYISLGFFVIGGIVAMIVGYMADSFNRKLVFAIVVCIGEVSCAATYFVPTESKADFWTGLWLTRAITGVAVGGALPIQFSIIGDLFGEKDRGKAVAFFSVANGVGFGSGQYVANIFSPDFRTPFLIVSFPTFFLVALFLYTTTEPKRGQAEQLLQDRREVLLEDDKHITWKKFQILMTTPSAFLAIIQGLPGSLPWGVIQVFLNDFLLEEKEQTEIDAANIILVFGLLTAISVVMGGFIVDRLVLVRPRILPVIAMVTTLASITPLVIVLRSTDLSFGGYISLMIIPGICSGMAGPILKGLLLHVTLPETRGTAFSLQSLLDELGKGLGPFLISAIIGFTKTREDGLVLGILGWIPAGLIMGCIAIFIGRDIRRHNLAFAEIYGVDVDDVADFEDNIHKEKLLPLKDSDKTDIETTLSI